MGVVLPSELDAALDLIGINWPNVDEDDYRDMAQAMREFADDIDDGAADAHRAITDLIGGNEGLAIQALERHWDLVKGKHLTNLAEAGRVAATALDAVAVLIEGAKIAAIAQLGILAAEIAAAIAAAPVTFGLSTLGGIAGTQATRIAVKRIFQEVCEEIASRIIEVATGPIFQALGAMAGDLVLQLGGNALGTQNGVDLGQTAKAGREGLDEGVDSLKSGGGMQLASAGGSSGGSMQLAGAGGDGGSSSGGGGGQFSMDLESYDRAGNGLKSAGGKIRDGAGSKLDRAKSSHGRARGKDALTNLLDPMVDELMEGIGKGVKRSASHLDESMTGGLKQMAKRHKDNDDETALSLKQLQKGNDGKTPMYLMSDDGTLKRLRTDGGTDKLTQDDRDRIGLNLTGDNAGRPLPGEPNLKLHGKQRPRPLSNSEQVELGSTPLSQAVQLARHSDKSYGNHKQVNGQDKFESNNYAAARFDSAKKDDGNFIMVARSSGFRHSERMIGFPVLRDGAGGRMTELYTERAPCSSAPNCSAWMKERLSHVDVTHSIDYGNTKESRAQGNAEMMDYLDRLKANRHK
ncbi:putative membrane protein YgcG [Streptomyces sp. SAI-208]|uniref:nucleic acid/nucleotide deaminase domain-containing protein n=2 Tax=Streptomyces TaxID=1883 RepID=UPI0024744587|nr:MULTISPECIES: nucleic acid/nucleotide deaminase domain-containing protein [unclassified Streptomyces]MDH6516084.1 putative membrane protein YgcG [Streptomyces sp. SAI-090]MDH6567389.1 putative membrane protein YgcG [Streptomyces sp. SAI-117]MDH6587678.1 putative membrane protein YgcG [Streptomyces sp. SAI-133]MDH6606911.1 putative membrane protein YgcG [Streptomyces sp. SAI-208]MDH6619829.1 putative membrane protein YgcG [Streptomyces sp. SAI-135]